MKYLESKTNLSKLFHALTFFMLGEFSFIEKIALRINKSLHCNTSSCALDIYRNKGGSRTCPACNKILSSRNHLCNSNAGTLKSERERPDEIGTEELNKAIPSIDNASLLASLNPLYCRSNLSITSLNFQDDSLLDCNVTSSV